jgi:hypothetical protein
VPQDYDVVPQPEAAGTSPPTERAAPALITTPRKARYAEARRLARNAGGGEVRLNGRDGKIRQSDTIAKPDPFPPRG